jgi:signal transduction histidine kinase
MSRLFWKFFLSILLAQLVVTFGVGAVFWLRDQNRAQAASGAPRIDTGPSAAFLIDAAAATLRHGGADALRQLLREPHRFPIFVLDADGRDLLDRSVNPALRTEAEQLLRSNTAMHAVRRLTGPDGKQYLIFTQGPVWRRGGPFQSMPPAVFSPEGKRPPPQEGPGAPPDPAHSPAPGMSKPGPETGGAAPPTPASQVDSRDRRPFQRVRFTHRPFVPYMTIVGAFLASLLFAALLAWYFSRPIGALRAAFDAAAKGDLQPRFAHLKPKGGDELKALGRDFDRMSAQLRQLMDGQRRLLHDVSHELRSPLARLQAAIGLAHQQPDKLAMSLERIERESVRMDKLVGELLTLARLESGPALHTREPVGFAELVEEIAHDARFEAEQMGKHLRLNGQSQALVEASPDLLWRAIENVVRNAIKHTPPGTAVDLTLADLPGEVRLTIADEGPGVVPEDLQAIFEPFHRSSATANTLDGHGLGLAIARRAIQAHGGRIEAVNGEHCGLCVSIVLPVLAPAAA